MISAKKFRDELKKQGVFYTNSQLAKKMMELLPDDVREVYDPTCGDGALLGVFSDEVEKYGQDILSGQVEIASAEIPNFIGVVGDTLESPAFSDRKFKYIVANPPFSIKWNPEHHENDARFLNSPALPPRGRADYAFLLHVLHYLADDGVAVCLCYPGVLYRGGAEGKIREWIVKNNWIDKIISVSGDYFDDTKTPTAIVVFRKNRENFSVEFCENFGEKRVVEIDEIAKNDYNLAVNQYIYTQTELKKIDPIELQREARTTFLEQLKNELEVDKKICEINLVTCGNQCGNEFDHLAYIAMIANTLQDHKKKHGGDF